MACQACKVLGKATRTSTLNLVPWSVQGDYLSIAGPIDRKSVRAQSHGDEIGALAEGESVSESQDSEQADARSKSETDLATSKTAGIAPVKGALGPNDPRFVEKEVI